MTALPAEQLIMAETDWRSVAADHAAVVDDLTAAHRSRVGTGRPHPVEDFLFSYYTLRPSQLRRWYPGAGVWLANAAERADWRFQQSRDGAVTVDVAALMAAHGDQIRFVRRLLGATAGRPAQFGCFGLHEWAMVFEATGEQLRHADWPLRLGQQGTDTVVRDHQIRCTHYDAYRFFTEPARPRNLLQPSLNTREQLEQPGCLHVGMDLYKWAYKLIPAVPSELLIDCFLLARDIREVDMRASPYDLAALGYQPIPIEIPAGKADYVARQREFADRSVPLRARLLDVTQLLTADD
ncbi:MAG: 3-methyladenine DNA glycosylase [Nakamurella sp.]